MTKVQAQERLQKLFRLQIAINLHALAHEQYTIKMEAIARRDAQLHPLDVPLDAALYVSDRQQLHAQVGHIRMLSNELGFTTDMPTAGAVAAAMQELERAHNVTLSFARERDAVLKRLQA